MKKKIIYNYKFISQLFWSGAASFCSIVYIINWLPLQGKKIIGWEKELKEGEHSILTSVKASKNANKKLLSEKNGMEWNEVLLSIHLFFFRAIS